MPRIDYDLENDLSLRKLKEAAALRGSPMASPTIRVGGRDIVNWVGHVNRVMEQTQGNRMEDESTARLRDLSQQQLGEVDAYNKAVATPGSKLLRQEGPTVDGGNIPDQQIPLSPEEENQRQMALSLDATRLPKARAMAEKFIQSGVGFPEKQAQLKAQQDMMREQQATRLAAQQQQAAMLEEGRNQRASDSNALRMTIAQIAQSNRASGSSGSAKTDLRIIDSVDPETGQATKMVIDLNATKPGTMFNKSPTAAAQKVDKGAKVGVAAIDDAIVEIDAPAAKGALGPINIIPGSELVRQYTNPEGVAARAAVSNIGSLKMHDRSGATVTVREMPRLKPFIPDSGDSPEAVKTKLRKLRNEYVKMQQEWQLKPVGTPTAPAALTGGNEEWVRGPDGKLVRK